VEERCLNECRRGVWMDDATFIPDEDELPRAEKMVKTLSRVADMRQRSYALACRIRDADDELAVEVIKTIWEKALQGEEDFLRLYNSLLVTGILAEVLGNKRLSDLVGKAQDLCHYSVAALLMDMPADGAGDLPFQPFLDGALKETPLGMRKALARRPDFKLIQRIARDQDHRVIRTLLDNPRLTEKDVIHIGATRPTSSKVLEVIYDHPKWISRYSVKKVIVFSPYSPLSLSIRLLTFMNLGDLEELCTTFELNELLRKQAERIIEEKNRLSSP
jgi:hypothetical protein